MAILAGDIGGTKTLLELSDQIGGDTRTIARRAYASQTYDTFTDLLSEFLADFCHSREFVIESACFGVAGPVQRQGSRSFSRITNLPWEIDSDLISNQFDIKKVLVINDFVAIGHGIEVLDQADLLPLQNGRPVPNSNRIVIGAGTGLGVAQLVWCGDRYHVFGTEGGHVDFAPVNNLQIELARYLMGRNGRVSCEELLSGPGLVNIYRFLHQFRSGDPSQLDQILKQPDAAAAIGSAAREGTDLLAREALQLFVEIYGAVSGNFALNGMATAGVFIAGGIAPKISTLLAQGAFIEAFNAKGKMAHLNQQMPVAIVMNPEVGLLGARKVASNMDNYF